MVFFVNECYSFRPDKTRPYCKVHQRFAKQAMDNSIIRCGDPYPGITQSRQEDGSCLCAVLNDSDGLILKCFRK